MPSPVHTDDAPAAIGPYSQAVVSGGFVFTAGQIALDPATMQVVPGSVAEQTDRVMHNLAAVLGAAGSDLSRVVKTTVFLVDMADFAAMNEIYGRHFGEHRPARSTVARQWPPPERQGRDRSGRSYRRVGPVSLRSRCLQSRHSLLDRLCASSPPCTRETSSCAGLGS